MRRDPHDFDLWHWCRRCGLGLSDVHNGRLACTPPALPVLALRQLDQIVARAPLVRLEEQMRELLARRPD